MQKNTSCLHLALVTLLTGVASPAAASDWSPCPGFERGASDQGNSVFFSPYTHHWRHSKEHRNVVLLSVQRHLPNDRACGVSLFSNSFGQPSVYAFTSWTWPRLSERFPNWYALVSAGLMYGYVEPHEDKVPLNVRGFSPAVIPALGYRWTERTAAELHILGTAAIMFGVSHRF